MLKKALFIIASVMIGLLLIVNSMGSSFYNQIIKQTQNAVEEKNYLHAERFVSYALDKDGMFYSDNRENGMHVDIYSSIIIANESVTDDNGEVTGSITVLEECIQISMFHLPADFALADKEVAEGETPIQGGVNLVLSDSSKVLFPFVETENESETISMYDYVNYYSFLPVFISYEDYVAKVGDKTIVSFEIIDGDGDLVDTIVPTKAISFDTAFHNDYRTVINNYNDLYRAYDETAEDAEAQVEAIQNAKNAIDDVAVSKSYVAQHNTDVIYKSSGYIWSLVLTGVIFLAIDGLLGFLLFRKKKASPYAPKRPMQYNGAKMVTPRAPEQFNRKDVFDAEEGTFVIDNKETLEESPSENPESEKVE